MLWLIVFDCGVEVIACSDGICTDQRNSVGKGVVWRSWTKTENHPTAMYASKESRAIKCSIAALQETRLGIGSIEVNGMIERVQDRIATSILVQPEQRPVPVGAAMLS